MKRTTRPLPPIAAHGLTTHLEKNVSAGALALEVAKSLFSGNG
jgi:hypothetical protein